MRNYGEPAKAVIGYCWEYCSCCTHFSALLLIIVTVLD